MDQDHQVLIGLINELEAGHGQKDQAEALQATFQHLRSYAAYHFGREEAVLRAVGYDTLAGHQAEHRAFEEKIEALALKLADNPGAAQREINDALLDYLRDWLRHHILVIDMSYKELVEGQPGRPERGRQLQGRPPVVGRLRSGSRNHCKLPIPTVFGLPGKN